jgi:two-component system, chemotaxis family, chemotaxis protein CheY
MKYLMTIDDSPSIRKLVSMTASMAGFGVVEAEHGQDALNKLKTCDTISVFICDVNMPVMDGITLVKNVRALPKYKATPIIMLTTESQDTKKKEGQEAGATGWIVKPFKQEALIKILQRLV